MQYIRNKEITRKRDSYADFSFLAALFSCAESSSRGICLEQTPSHTCFFKTAAMEPALC